MDNESFLLPVHSVLKYLYFYLIFTVSSYFYIHTGFEYFFHHC